MEDCSVGMFVGVAVSRLVTGASASGAFGFGLGTIIGETCPIFLPIIVK